MANFGEEDFVPDDWEADALAQESIERVKASLRQQVYRYDPQAHRDHHVRAVALAGAATDMTRSLDFVDRWLQWFPFTLTLQRHAPCENTTPSMLCQALDRFNDPARALVYDIPDVLAARMNALLIQVDDAEDAPVKALVAKVWAKRWGTIAVDRLFKTFMKAMAEMKLQPEAKVVSRKAICAQLVSACVDLAEVKREGDRAVIVVPAAQWVRVHIDVALRMGDVMLAAMYRHFEARVSCGRLSGDEATRQMRALWMLVPTPSALEALHWFRVDWAVSRQRDRPFPASEERLLRQEVHRAIARHEHSVFDSAADQSDARGINRGFVEDMVASATQVVPTVASDAPPAVSATDEDCVICMDDSCKSPMVALPCCKNPVFHRDCVVALVLKGARLNRDVVQVPCPLCRSPFLDK